MNNSLINKILKKRFMITGGAGFIGSSLIRFLIEKTSHQVLNLDKLTYASNIESLRSVSKNSRYQFVQGDICNKKIISKLFTEFKKVVKFEVVICLRKFC